MSTVDSNSTGLRIAVEETLGVLPGSPVWRPGEPNSYSDFGGQITTLARQPIADDRQRKKGVTTDLSATAGFETDFTQENMIYLLEGFFMRDWIEKPTTNSRDGTQVVITAVDATNDQYEAASGLNGLGFIVNHLVWAENFADASNNGLRQIDAVAAGAIDVVENLTVADGSPAATAMLTAVGYEFASATLNVNATVSAYPRLERASGVVDFTTIGIEAGDFIWIGGDASDEDFVTAANNGFARVRAVAAAYIELDKTDSTMVDETGTGLTIRIFFGHRLNNAVLRADYTRRSFQLERTLGEDEDGTQSEYVIGAVPNTLNFKVPVANKITVDVGFIGIDHETYTGLEGVKSGTRPSIEEADAFNTSSDFSRLRMAPVSTTDSNPDPSFAFLTDMNISFTNNVEANKAVGTLGAIGMNTGMLEVGGSITAYFSTLAAVAAVRENTSLSLDWAIVKNNAGYVLDLPLITVGDARPNIELNKPITLPLNMQAAKDADLGYTIAMHEFRYLPDAAE